MNERKHGRLSSVPVRVEVKPGLLSGIKQEMVLVVHLTVLDTGVVLALAHVCNRRQPALAAGAD